MWVGSSNIPNIRISTTAAVEDTRTSLVVCWVGNARDVVGRVALVEFDEFGDSSVLPFRPYVC